MGKPRMYGYYKPCVPNSRMDRQKQPNYFHHGKDNADSEERLYRKLEKQLRKEKTK